jgi:hypothetical protein
MKKTLEQIARALVIILMASFALFMTAYLIYNTFFQQSPGIHIYVVDRVQATNGLPEVQKSLVDVIERSFDKNNLMIQTTVTIFGCCLAIFTVIFGLFYFSRLREAEGIVDKIKNTPEIFVSEFYKTQFRDNLSNLFSEDNIVRTNEINRVSNNSELSSSDFEIFKNVLQRECDYKKNNYFYSNITILVNILMRLDYERTIEFLLEILGNDTISFIKKNTLYGYVVVSDVQKAREYILEKIENDTTVGPNLVGQMLSVGIINDYIEPIVSRGTENVIQMISGNLMNNIWNIDQTKFLDALNQRNVISPNLQNQLVFTRHIDRERIARIILKQYKDDQTANVQAFTLYVSNIVGSPEEREIFAKSVSDLNMKGIVDFFFSINQHFIPPFENRFGLPQPLSAP